MAEKSIRYFLRAHLQSTTVDFPAVKSPAHCRTVAKDLLQEGIWLGNRLYPPNNIVYIEMLTDESSN